MGEEFDIRDENGARPTVVVCPSCNQPGFHDVWPWIDRNRDNDAAKLLLSGDLFKYQCPVCNDVSTLAYDCMYHDSSHRTLMLFSTRRFLDEQCIAALDNLADKAQWQSGTQTPTYQKRLVFNPFEFCEKARVLENGYDDRVIELLKVALKRGMLREGIIGVNDTMIYERTMEDGGISFIVVGEIPGDVVGVPQGYTYLETLLSESDADLSNTYTFDHAWALRFLP